jgi:hypothetical protein
VYPAGRDWAIYVLALTAAVVWGFFIRRAYRIEVLEFTESDTELVWVFRQVRKRPFWLRSRRAE